VEHPVTELVTGLDLVREQLRIAAGEPLGFTQADVAIRGSAIECRITAEDADAGFLPSLGVVGHVNEPSGPGVRVDSSLFEGMEVGPNYDSLVSKLIVWGADRTQALARLRRALDEYQVLGLKTTLPFHRALADDPNFIANNIHTRYLDTRDEPGAADEEGSNEALVIAALLSHQRRGGGTANAAGAAPRSGWKIAGREAGVNRHGGGPWRSTF
jgi:acetyl/propionyl-CoA carboxylase alpha subunit